MRYIRSTVSVIIRKICGLPQFGHLMDFSIVTSKIDSKELYNVQPHEIARYKREELMGVPDSDKVYFYGWNNHLKDKKKAQNIEKTRILCGDRVADYCQRNNISSMWVAQITKHRNYHPPQLSRDYAISRRTTVSPSD